MAELENSSELQSTTQTLEVSDFSSLLTKEFKPRSDHAKDAIETAVHTLAEFALKDVSVISDDSLRSIQAIIAQIDKKISEQVNLILHHEDFQKLEGSWRGLHYMINNTETDEMLKIRVLISRKRFK